MARDSVTASAASSAMTGVAHDILIAHAYVVGRGDEADAQRMPAKPCWKPA
jgi:hypothetical protein